MHQNEELEQKINQATYGIEVKEKLEQLNEGIKVDVKIPGLGYKNWVNFCLSQQKRNNLNRKLRK